MEIDFSPLKSGSNVAPFEVLALIRDISRRKHTEEQIMAAQKAAEEGSLAKSQFLAVIGHELRTPLNAIVGFADMMANGIGGTLEPVHLEYAGLISQSGHHLLEVVNMLLDMSKIEAGRFELQTASFAPENLVAPCIQIVSKAAREKGVEVEVKLGRNLPDIIGDERACRQILINLLSNAIKFSEPGGAVTWSMKRQAQQLCMSVADSGIGMSKDVVARLGEPFFQAEAAADRRYEGTGLGVSIVKGLVGLHDGMLRIVSAPGQGTTITVLLPLAGPQNQSTGDNRLTRLQVPTDRTQSEPWQEPRKIAQ
jgi:two-component system, cell cycle sensor histidine kinase DivJ